VGKLLSFPGRRAVAARGVAQPEEHVYEHDAEPNPYAGWLTVHSVVKAFKKRTVVRGVSLEVARGEAVGLLGPNGAGKTTVFYMITGLIPADEGSIRIDGRDVTKLPMYRRARLGIARCAARRVPHHPAKDLARHPPLRRRAAARRNCPVARQPPVLHAARRALRRHRPDRGQ
jgi:ABC-type glutathione transport system ATPase component